MAHEKQKTRGILTRKRMAEKMDAIRRGDVERHKKYAARQDLRMRQVAAQRVASMQMELDRLHESHIRGSGLDQLRFDRARYLRDAINNKGISR